MNSKQKAMVAEKNFALEVKSFKGPTPADVYHIIFGRSGWAILLLDEATGTVAIHSDYGDWTYSWSANGRGKGVSLKEFFCSCGPDYLSEKFDDSRDEFDQEGTVREMRRQIIDDRRARAVDKDDARKCWDALEDSETYHSGEHFYDRLDHDVDEYFDGEAHTIFVYKKTSKFMWLRHGLLPAILAEIRKTLPAKVLA